MSQPKVKNEEINLDPNKFIVSKTDPKGIISYVNDYFIDVVGYSKDELINKPHNIIRHPDMPKIVFKMMWDRINKGQNIKAIVKNLAKDGRYYWVLTDFEPKYDPLTNEIVSHTAYRKAAPRKAIETIIPIYAKLVEIEKELGMKGSQIFLVDFLEQKNTSYDKFIDDLVGYRGVFKLVFEQFKKLFR